MIFAFHGYPRMIHWLTYRRHNHDNFHVRGYKEEGTTTTPFDMVVLNNLDRYQLALDAISRCRGFSTKQKRPTATGARWSVTNFTSASTARICRRCRTGAGPHLPMTSASPRSVVLALNQRLVVAQVRA